MKALSAFLPPRLRRGCCLLLLLHIAGVPGLAQEFWPQFRGPLGQGVSTSAQPPLSFSKTNALWDNRVAAGHSSPAIWGNLIFLTCVEDGKLDCRAYDRSNGKLRWTRPVPAEKLEATHTFNNSAASTPAADAELVVFYFGSYGLMAFSHEGKSLWNRPLPPQVSRGNYGSGTSPVLCHDLVLLAKDTDQGGSQLLAFKRRSGELAWEAPRPLFKAGWSTPVVWTSHGRSEVVLLGSKKLTAYDAANGKELWAIAGFPMETACSPAFDGERLFACSAAIGGRASEKVEFNGWGQLLPFDSDQNGKVQIEELPDDFRFTIRPELPKGHPGRDLPFKGRDMLKGMDADKDGAVSKQEWNQGMEAFEKMDAPVLMAIRGGTTEKPDQRVAWQYTRGISEIPSPLATHGKVFLVRDGGILLCLDAEKGTMSYQERLGVGGGYAASPVSAAGRIYLASQSGTIVVIDAGSDSLKVLATNPLGETITATPALVDDVIYVRTAEHLYAFGGKAP